MTEKEFLDEMEWFCEFYEKKITSLQAKIWFEIFENETKEFFSAALKKHIKISLYPYFPAVGNITESINSIKNKDHRISGLTKWTFS